MALLRRSELATPASNEGMFLKAAASHADMVFLDLEDACAPAVRVEARGKAVQALNDLDWAHTARGVRINGVGTHWCHGDVIELVTGAGENLDTLIVPKATQARDIWWVDVLLTQLEEALGLERRIRLEALIEDAAGLANAVEIAQSSDRLDAITFGAGDMSVSMQARVDTSFRPSEPYPGDFWHYARWQVVTAARTAGVLAIDAPYPDYKDHDGYAEQARWAASMGYDGKWAIHPDQVTIANEVFAPTEREIERAHRNREAWQEGERRGLGAVGVDGRLVDSAHVKLAERTLAQAEAIESRRQL